MKIIGLVITILIVIIYAGYSLTQKTKKMTISEWQIDKDKKVLLVLEANGDDHEKPHTIDHFCYFQSKESAEEFCQWAAANNYNLQDGSPEFNSEQGVYAVLFTHTGTTLLQDITSHTTTLAEKAEALGGNYDGWGTEIVIE